MFIFIRLLLAHCLGDFPFQSNHIFKLKQKGPKGVLLHAFIIVACCLALCWPYLFLPQVLVFIAFIGVTHFIQDYVKIKFSNPKSQFWLYILDQLSHAGVIALLFLTSLKDLQPPLDQANVLLRLYNNDQLIIYLIVLILATYNGFFLIESFKTSFWGGTRSFDRFEKSYGMLERAMIVSAFLARDHFLLLVPAVLLMRPLTFFLFKERFKFPENFISFKEICLGWGVGILGGLALFLLQPGHPIY